MIEPKFTDTMKFVAPRPSQLVTDKEKSDTQLPVFP